MSVVYRTKPKRGRFQLPGTSLETEGMKMAGEKKKQLHLSSICTSSCCHSAAGGLNSGLVHSIIWTRAGIFEGLYYV